MRSARAWMGALLIWAPSTSATIWFRVVSAPMRVTRTSSMPRPFTVPAHAGDDT